MAKITSRLSQPCPRYVGESKAQAFATVSADSEDIVETTSVTDLSFRRLLDHAPYATYLRDHDRLCYVNRAMVSLLGYDSVEELLAIPRFSTLFSEDKRQEYREGFEKNGYGSDDRARLICKDGSEITVDVSVCNLDVDGARLRFGTIIDQTEAIAAKVALERSEKRFKDFAQSAADWFWETDRDHRFIYLSANVESILGVSSATMIGKTYREIALASTAHYEVNWKKLQEIIDAWSPIREFRYSLCGFDGDNRHLIVNAMPNIDSEGEFQGYRGTGRDITRQQRLENESIYHATHDSLTDLFNRRHFNVVLRRAIDEAASDETQRALAYIDLDNFKAINDHQGHAAGDRVLVDVARLIEQVLGEDDLVARLGGDEFAVIFSTQASMNRERILQQLISRIESYRPLADTDSYRVGLSIGVVNILQAGDTETAMSQADAACYVAKRNGKNCYVEYSSQSQAMTPLYAAVAG